MHHHAIPFNTIHYHAKPCNTMQNHAIPCNIMHYHAIPCNTMQYHDIPCNTMHYHAMPCNTMQYHAILCNTMQYHAIPCIINNCWRGVPLPCGQYNGHFCTWSKHLIKSTSVWHLRLAWLNSCQLWGTLAAWKRIERVLMVHWLEDSSTRLKKEKTLDWTNKMIIQWAWASVGISPGRLSQCQSGEPPRSSCCGSPEVLLIACLSFTLWKAIPGMSGLFQRLSPSCQGPYWGPPEPVSRSPGSYLPSPARPDFRLLSNGIIFAHSKSWFMTTC